MADLNKSDSDESSDNESTGEEIPFKKTNNAENDSGDEEGSEEGEDVYVEALASHVNNQKHRLTTVQLRR